MWFPFQVSLKRRFQSTKHPLKATLSYLRSPSPSCPYPFPVQLPQQKVGISKKALWYSLIRREVCAWIGKARDPKKGNVGRYCPQDSLKKKLEISSHCVSLLLWCAGLCSIGTITVFLLVHVVKTIVLLPLFKTSPCISAYLLLRKGRKDCFYCRHR